MEIIIKSTAQEAASYVALLIAEKIRANKKANIGFATGRTMDAVYYNLTLESKKAPLNCSDINAFIVDEYLGLNPGHKNSYVEYLNQRVFSLHDFKKENIYYPDVMSENEDDACEYYEKSIEKLGGIDFQILGIGRNGHIALNEPGSSFDSRTRVVGLTSSTINSNKVLFRNETDMPQRAITMGLGTIFDSKEIILIATGETKSEIIMEFINSDISTKIPATILKDHTNFTLVLDKQAAKLLK